ncbi:MAG: fibronectin type III domain-containing protein [Paludibacter sp.]|nr:fibronectin type III domain-containing protein [Paludibacter sp.]
MKKITLLLALIAITSVANATVYLDEIFDYADGALKTMTGWTAGGTYGTWVNDFTVQSPSLTYSNDGGSFILSGQGKAVTCDYQTPYGSTNYLNYKNFTGSAITSGTVYVSFLYTPSGATNNQSQCPVMSISVPGSNTGVQVWVGKALTPNDGTHFRFGTTKGSTSSGDIKWGATEFSNSMLSDVFFIVLKSYVESTAANCVSSIFINPLVGSESEPSAYATDATSTANVRTSLQTIQFKVNGSSKEVFRVGGVRVSSTWEEAVAAKSTAAVPLDAPTVGVATSVGAESFTANWTAVANATGYTVRIYQGEDLKGSHDADGQSTESLKISGLWVETTYTYKVIAKGDAVDFLNSEESTASVEFTTLEGLTSINTVLNDETWGTLYNSGNQPSLGAFPSSTGLSNGFDLINAFLYDITKYDFRDERKQYGLRVDRATAGGMIVFPVVKSIEQMEIHAVPGGTPRDFVLKELVGSIWTTVGTYAQTSPDYNVFIIPISRTLPTKFRIENPASGQSTFYQIITRTTNPTLLDAPVIGVATAVNSTHFTAQWTAVTNATGYKVRVYEGTTLVKTVEASGQPTQSIQVTDLTAETEYTYKVLAVGDGFVDYADSYLSVASEPVTTGITSVLDNLSIPKLLVAGKSITASERGTFEIYNLQGSQVYQVKNANSVDTNLSTGLYIMKFTNEAGKQLIQKITIN